MILVEPGSLADARGTDFMILVEPGSLADARGTDFMILVEPGSLADARGVASGPGTIADADAPPSTEPNAHNANPHAAPAPNIDSIRHNRRATVV